MSKNRRRTKQRKGPFSSHKVSASKGGTNYSMRNQCSLSTFWCPEKTLYIQDLLTRLFSLLPATHYGSSRYASRPVASVRVRSPASISLHPFFSVVCTLRYPSPEQKAGTSRTRSLFSEALENLVPAHCAAALQLNPYRDRKCPVGAGLTD